MNIFKIILLILIVQFSLNLYAADYAVISDLGASAHTISLGNIEGASRTADAIFSNPAGLYGVQSISLSMFTTTIMEDVNYLNVSLCSKTPIGRFGVGYYSATVDGIPITDMDTDESFYVSDYFDYKNSIYKFTYQLSFLKKNHIGINFSQYEINYHTLTGSGNGFDIGYIREFKPFNFSLFAQNITNSYITYSNKQMEKIPYAISSSLEFPILNFTLYPQLKYTSDIFLPSFGVSYKPRILPYIEFTAGFRSLLDYTNSVQQKGTFGIGLYLMGLQFNYAYERSDYLATDHHSYFSLSYNFLVKRRLMPKPIRKAGASIVSLIKKK